MAFIYVKERKTNLMHRLNINEIADYYQNGPYGTMIIKSGNGQLEIQEFPDAIDSLLTKFTVFAGPYVEEK